MNPNIIIKNKKRVLQTNDLSVINFVISINKRKTTKSIIEHKNAAVILAIQNDKVILEKQYRFPYGYV